MGKKQTTPIVSGTTTGNTAKTNMNEVFVEHNANPEQYIETLLQSGTSAPSGGRVLKNRLLGGGGANGNAEGWSYVSTGKYRYTRAGAFACGATKMTVRFGGRGASFDIDWTWESADSIYIETFNRAAPSVVANGILTAGMKACIYIETFSYIET